MCTRRPIFSKVWVRSDQSCGMGWKYEWVMSECGKLTARSSSWTLTVLREDVRRVLRQTLADDELVGLHHVGAEDLLVVLLGHVGSGCSRVALQQVAAASLRRKHQPDREVH